MRPKKKFGQHFLVDKNILAKIVSVVRPGSGDVIVEIGAGKGALTEYLVRSGARVISIEIDKELAKYLGDRFGETDNLQIIGGDALEVDYEEIFDRYGRFRVVGNIPYNITSPLIFKMIENRAFIRDVHFMVQKDVALRLVARPGTKAYGILSVILGLVAEIKRVFDVSRNCFRPVPDVESSFVSIVFRDLEFDEGFLEKFIEIVKVSFGKRRKMLRNSLSKFVSDCGEISFELNRRPDSMSVEDFVKLTQLIYRDRF